jgi:hypothetical protein
MSVFALGILLPLLAYCVVQTVRDYRSRDFLVCAWGIAMTSVVLIGIVGVFQNPGY